MQESGDATIASRCRRTALAALAVCSEVGGCGAVTYPCPTTQIASFGILSFPSGRACCRAAAAMACHSSSCCSLGWWPMASRKGGAKSRIASTYVATNGTSITRSRTSLRTPLKPASDSSCSIKPGADRLNGFGVPGGGGGNCNSLCRTPIARLNIGTFGGMLQTAAANLPFGRTKLRIRLKAPGRSAGTSGRTDRGPHRRNSRESPEPQRPLGERSSSSNLRR